MMRTALLILFCSTLNTLTSEKPFGFVALKHSLKKMYVPKALLISIAPFWWTYSQAIAAFYRYGPKYDYVEHFYDKDAVIKDADPIVRDFVRNELHKLGLANAHTVHVKTTSDYVGYETIYNNGIIIGEFYQKHPDVGYWSLCLALHDSQHNSYDHNTRKKLATVRAIIAHEKHHLENNDSLRLASAGMSIPIATYLSSIAALKNVSFFSNARLHGSVMLGFLQYCANAIAFRALQRQLERQADKAIPDDPLLLRSAHDFFLLSKSNEKTALEKIFTTHPSNKERADAFAKRLKKIETGT